MGSSRLSSASPLLTLAGLAVAGYALSRLRRDAHFFREKVVLVTGGSRGLGLAIARRLRAQATRTGAQSRSQELTPGWKTSFADAASVRNNEA